MADVSAHRIALHFRVQGAELDTIDVQFPFPILTESGLVIQTESGEDLAIEGGTAVTILLGHGVVLSELLHVVTED